MNGVCSTSRCLGNYYLYPLVIPEPYTIQKALKSEDQFAIIANSGLWTYLSHREAVEEIQYIANPVVAAKRLQDLAQAYGCKDNISVLVIKFNFSSQDFGSTSSMAPPVVPTSPPVVPTSPPVVPTSPPVVPISPPVVDRSDKPRSMPSITER